MSTPAGPRSSTLRRSVVGDAPMTHGTLETRDLPLVRRAYEDLLGLRVVRHSPVSQMIAGGGNVAIACVQAKVHEQGTENRWVLLVDTPEQVASMHERARRASPEFGLRQVGDLVERGAERSFLLQDQDSNWWEVSSRPHTDYQAVFERGDVV